jgi:uncharacterized protein (TIGR03382 family)
MLQCMKRSVTMTIGLLGCLCTLQSSPAWGGPPSFETWATEGQSVETGEPVSAQEDAIPVWWDVTLDGQPDLVYVSRRGIERLSRSEGGGFEIWPVSAPPGVWESVGGVQQVLAPIDTDGDGSEELLMVALNATLWRVVGVDSIVQSSIPLPAIRTRAVNEAAVGDLNRDGRPDIYLGQGHANPERLNYPGCPDAILMNRGGGRFELIDAPLAREAATLGATLVDLDGDGRLDIAESVEISWLVGPSRMLLNRTPPGAANPVFIESPHGWDTGTSGMGVAIADVDGDGHLDVYSSSVGHDRLAMGQPDGSYHDETYHRGIVHRWASLGMRVQWSPTFVDMNLDGRLDILVRHGLPINFVFGGFLATQAADLIYLQTPDGTFERTPAPEAEEPGNGIRFAIGDLDADGRPDAARDGGPGSVYFWHNQTSLEPTGRAITVRFVPTISGRPATGTLVRGTCGEITLLRRLTTGGKMGTASASEAHFAWTSCASGPVTFEVHWPSGAVTQGEVEEGRTLWEANEPQWVTSNADGSLTLDPTGTGAEQACVAQEETWACCDARCSKEALHGSATLVRLDDGPIMALPQRDAAWLLVTSPHLPRPGHLSEVHLLHVGGPETFPGDTASLQYAGQPIEWDEVDHEARRYVATVDAPADATTLSLSLKIGGEEVASWAPSVGHLFDRKAPYLDLYPVRPLGTGDDDDGWQLQLHAAPGVDNPWLVNGITVEDLAGNAIPFDTDIMNDSMRRVGVRVGWTALEGLEDIVIGDGAESAALILPVVNPADASALTHEISAAQCGIMYPRIAPVHGVSLGILTLMNADGHAMTVPPESLELSVEGGSLKIEAGPMTGVHDLLFMVAAGAEEGPGRVIVRDALGRELTRCDFEVVIWPTQPVDVGQSWATLSAETLDRATDQRARLRIGMTNAFGELLGADVWPTVLLTGGTWATPLNLTMGGSLAGDIAPTDDATTVLITVTHEGAIIASFSVPVLGESVTPPPIEEGCQSTHGHPHTLWLAWALLGLFAWRRRVRSAPLGDHIKEAA